MSDRDWDADLKKIDRAIERAPDTAAPPGRPGATGKPSSSGGAPVQTSNFGVFLRLGLTVALGIGVIFWPYSARCGVGLAGFLGVVAVLTIAGAWSSVWTWRHRAARGHVLSLLIILWGLLLASIEVLPRIGYAVATSAHPATWICP
ncbi:MAG: hypothetical protein IT356_03975 [Gemmatimonadaceae bacterium]|nr:hypothetical protein [Gemmatimonadaceae bacterium]